MRSGNRDDAEALREPNLDLSAEATAKPAEMTERPHHPAMVHYHLEHAKRQLAQRRLVIALAERDRYKRALQGVAMLLDEILGTEEDQPHLRTATREAKDALNV